MYYSRDEESNNPRIMPQYLPWWFGPNSSSEDFKSSSHKVADLRELAQQRGIPNVGLKKAELAELLTKVNALYDLSGAVEYISILSPCFSSLIYFYIICYV